jgi:hypothetical protein
MHRFEAARPRLGPGQKTLERILRVMFNRPTLQLITCNEWVLTRL